MRGLLLLAALSAASAAGHGAAFIAMSADEREMMEDIRRHVEHGALPGGRP